MAASRYLIVGGGMTGHAAAGHPRAGRRRVDAARAEPHPPYARPPLSKELWNGEEETVWRGTAELGVDLRPGRASSRSTPTSGGQGRRRREVPYEKLLLATGGTPRRLPRRGEDVVYFRTLDDYRRLRGSPARREVTVIGGGFIGSEIAAALAMNGCTVTIVFPDEGIGARLFPAELVVLRERLLPGEGRRGASRRARREGVETAP